MCTLCERPWLGVYSKSKYANRHVDLPKFYYRIQNGRGFNQYFDHPMKKFQRGVFFDEKLSSLRYVLDSRKHRRPIDERWPRWKF